MSDKPKRIKTLRVLKRKIRKVEDWVEENYGFRPNVIDDITGLRRNSFSDVYDPLTFEREQFWPKRKTADPIQPSQWPEVMTTVNGSEPPAEVSRYTDGIKYLLNAEFKGKRYVVETGNRASGTRSGVHMHESGGVTWILDGGDMSIYVQGLTTEVFKEEERFYMPSSVPMSAVNVSGKDSVQMNIFVAPIGESLATVLEPSFAAGKS